MCVCVRPHCCTFAYYYYYYFNEGHIQLCAYSVVLYDYMFVCLLVGWFVCLFICLLIYVNKYRLEKTNNDKMRVPRKTQKPLYHVLLTDIMIGAN